jgi:hypothetical protein
MKSTCPPAPPIAASLILPAIFLGSNYVSLRPDTLIFSVFSFFYSFRILSFSYALLFRLSFSFSFSSYSSLLILLFLSLLILLVGAILLLLILPFFDPFGVKFIYIPVRPYVLTIFVYSFSLI